MGNFMASDDRFDVVLDLDDTLVFMDLNTSKPDILLSYPEHSRMITYCLTPGAVPFLVTLMMTIPNCHISFYSAGEHQRNLAIVKNITESLKRELAKHGRRMSPFQSVRVLSRDQVDGFGRKNLLNVHNNLSLDRAILVDDNMTACKEHENNLIRVSPRPSELSKRVASVEEKALAEGGLAYALGKILHCYDKWKHERVPVPEAMAELQKCEMEKIEANYQTENETGSKVFTEIGLHEIRKYYPDFHLIEN